MEELNVAIIVDNSYASSRSREKILQEAELVVLSLPESANLSLIAYGRPNQDPKTRGLHDQVKPLVKLGHGKANRAEMLNRIETLEFDAFGRPLTCAMQEAESQFKNASKDAVNEVVYIGSGGNRRMQVDTCGSPLPSSDELESEQITFSALYSDNGNAELSSLAEGTHGMSRQFDTRDAVHAAAKITANIMSHVEQKSVRGKLLNQTENQIGK